MSFKARRTIKKGIAKETLSWGKFRVSQSVPGEALFLSPKTLPIKGEIPGPNPSAHFPKVLGTLES